QQGKITSAPAIQAPVTTTKSAKKFGAKISDLAATTTSTQTFDAYKAMIAKQAASYASRAITDAATGKYLVQVMPNGRVPVVTLQSEVQASFPTKTGQAIDQNYAGHGVIEAYVSLNDVPAIAATEGVGSV